MCVCDGVCVMLCVCVCVCELCFSEGWGGGGGGGGGGGVQCDGDWLHFLMCASFHIECLCTHNLCAMALMVCVCVCVCVCVHACGGDGGMCWHIYVCMLCSDIFMKITVLIFLDVWWSGNC